MFSPLLLFYSGSRNLGAGCPYWLLGSRSRASAGNISLMSIQGVPLFWVLSQTDTQTSLELYVAFFHSHLCSRICCLLTWVKNIVPLKNSKPSYRQSLAELSSLGPVSSGLPDTKGKSMLWHLFSHKGTWWHVSASHGVLGSCLND